MSRVAQRLLPTLARSPESRAVKSTGTRRELYEETLLRGMDVLPDSDLDMTAWCLPTVEGTAAALTAEMDGDFRSPPSSSSRR